MFLGFNKLKKKGKDIIHLSNNGWSTVCGLSLSGKNGEDYVSIGNRDFKEDENICQNCRQSVLAKARDYESK